MTDPLILTLRTPRALVVALCSLVFLAIAATAQPDRGGARSVHGPAARSVLFAENIGQWSPHVRFQGTSGATRISFAGDGVEYAYLVDSLARGGSRLHRLRTEFIGARQHVRIAGEHAAITRYNYYLGPDESDWHLGARGFAAVRYHGLYEGIDAIYYAREGQLKYDFVVAPGARHDRIRLRYRGARSLRVSAAGELEVTTAFGSVREAPPYSYQEIGGRRVEVAARYRLIAGDVYGFELGEFDRRYAVVIDPCLSVEYSTYFGAGGFDVVSALATDSSGAAYVTGLTRSPDFPVTPERQIEQDNWAFISKISPDGTQIIYSTVIGPSYDGPYDESFFNGRPSFQFFEPLGEDVEVTPNGEAVLAMTLNRDGATTTSGAYRRTRSSENLSSRCGPPIFANYDCYVARFAGDGRLQWGTYLGGSGNDYVTDIALDNGGAVYMTGLTYSPRCGSQGDAIGFPLTVPRDRFGSADSLRGFETFVAKLSSDGRTLNFGAIYGGTGDEYPSRIALAPSGAVYILGSTTSNDLPTTPNALAQTRPAGGSREVVDLYLARIDLAAGALQYSTYVPDNGGVGRRGLGVGVLANRTTYSPVGGMERQHRRQGLLVESGGGTVVIAGSTRSTSLPGAASGFQSGPRNDAPDSNGYDCFLLRLNTGNNQVLGATYLGGTAYDALGGITFDRFGDIAVGLSTTSRDFPLSPVSLQKEFKGNVEGAIVTLSPDLQRLTYASYYGGAVLPSGKLWEQSVFGVTADSRGAVYMFGGTSSGDFPLSNPALKPSNDYYGGYIVKFSAPTAPKIGAGLKVVFEPNMCGDLQTKQQVIFNSGQSPMRIDNIRLLEGKYFTLVNPPQLPFTLGPCDTLALTIGFKAGDLDCRKRGLDSLIIVAPEAIVPRASLAITGTRTCVGFAFLDSTINLDYKLGSGYLVGFDVYVREGASQRLTLVPAPGNKGIFVPPEPIVDKVYPEGTSVVGFVVTAQDTGTYCEEFTAIVEPCNRVTKLRICVRVRSGIFSAPELVDYGLISCKEITEPLVVRNVGNDTLTVGVAFVGGPTPGDINFLDDVQTPRKVGPRDSTEFKFVVRPVGAGVHESIIVFQTDEGGENGKQRWVRVTSELDSVAIRLRTADVVGGFGEIVELPVEFEPIVSGRVPLEELTLHAKFNRRMLDVVGVNQIGTIAGGWELSENRTVADGAIFKFRKGSGGATFTNAGRLMNLQLKVLRGDSMSTRLDLELSGASSLCLWAEIDKDRLFQLNQECAANLRLLFSGRSILKQSIPNPGSHDVTIPYRVPETGHVTLIVYDAMGREALRLLDGPMHEGDATLTFDARALPPGRYYYRITAGPAAETRTMVIER